MKEEIRFQGRDILLDTNLLVILVIGYTHPLALSRISYSIFDFELLEAIIRTCRRCITTPYIIAETSNILEKVKPHDEACRKTLGKILPLWKERYVRSELLLTGPDNKIATALGVADGSTLHVAKKGTIILTTDDPLAAWLERRGHKVFRYQVLRELQKKLIR